MTQLENIAARLAHLEERARWLSWLLNSRAAALPPRRLAAVEQLATLADDAITGLYGTLGQDWQEAADAMPPTVKQASAPPARDAAQALLKAAGL